MKGNVVTDRSIKPNLVVGGVGAGSPQVDILYSEKQKSSRCAVNDSLVHRLMIGDRISVNIFEFLRTDTTRWCVIYISVSLSL